MSSLIDFCGEQLNRRKTMSKLDLIPALYLCRKIPDGEFKNSAFCWVFDTKMAGTKRPKSYDNSDFFQVLERPVAEHIMELENWGKNPPVWPAPTIEEIAVCLPEWETGGGNFTIHSSCVRYDYHFEEKFSFLPRPEDETFASIALQLWFHFRRRKK